MTDDERLEEELDAKIQARIMGGKDRSLTEEEMRLCERCGKRGIEMPDNLMGPDNPEADRWEQEGVHHPEFQFGAESPITLQLCRPCEIALANRMKRLVLEEIPERPKRNILVG